MNSGERLPAPVGGNAGRVLFLSWGRRGSMSWLALSIAEALGRGPGGDALSYSTTNELADALQASGPAAWPFRTFARGTGAATGLPRFRRDANALVRRLKAEGFGGVVVLMSHVWTPLLAPLVRRAGLQYTVVVHDAARHPGDRTGLLTRWLLGDVRYADRVVTLSQAVADRLIAAGRVHPWQLVVLPHPPLDYGGRALRRRSDGPLRVLFLGRIMAYKGLGLLVEAVEMLRRDGVPVTLSVYGEGRIDGLMPRLAGLGATVVNRWVDHGEIGAILAAHDVLALPYVEASQSGVAAAAHGAGLPIVATPVGGLAEQVLYGIDGLIAAAVTAPAFAATLARLATDRDLYDRLAAGAAASRAYDVPAFAQRLRAIALGSEPPP